MATTDKKKNIGISANQIGAAVAGSASGIPVVPTVPGTSVASKSKSAVAKSGVANGISGAAGAGALVGSAAQGVAKTAATQTAGSGTNSKTASTGSTGAGKSSGASGGTGAAAPAQTAQTATPDTTQSIYTQGGYDPAADAAYMEAMGLLDAAMQDKPTYAGTFEAQMMELYNQIAGREPFQYDLNGDMLYQQYKDQYAMQGQMAMRDTMGQAAALTGGYGSSYAQSVGQQQYDAYLQQLNEVVPELYGMALDQYNAEGDALMNQYGMLGEMRDNEYGQFQDSMDNYWQNVNYYQGQADTAYNRGLAAEESAYSRQQAANDDLAYLITTLGYTPTAEEMAAAGMTRAQFNTYMKYYTDNNKPKTGGGGGGGNSTNWYETVKANAAADAADGVTSNAMIIGDIATAYDVGLITKEQRDELEAIYNRPDLHL